LAEYLELNLLRLLQTQSLLGPELGILACETIRTKLRAIDTPVVCNIDITNAFYIEYSFVEPALGPILDAAATAAPRHSIVVTCAIDIDGYQIRKGLLYRALPSWPGEEQWNEGFKALNRFAVLADSSGREPKYEYLGVDEPELLALLEHMRNVDTYSSLEMINKEGDPERAVRMFDELLRRRMIVEVQQQHRRSKSARAFASVARIVEKNASRRRHG